MNSRSNLDDRTGIMSENDWRRRQRVLSSSVCKPVPQTRGPDRQDERPCCGTLLRLPKDGNDGSSISDNALIHDTTAFAFRTWPLWQVGDPRSSCIGHHIQNLSGCGNLGKLLMKVGKCHRLDVFR